MELKTITEVKKTANAKWREYREAEKATKGKEPIYTDLKKMYWQIKHGKVLVNINDVIRAGGVHSNQHPKLAICRASSKSVTCEYFQNGDVKFTGENVRWKDRDAIVQISSCLPRYHFTPNNNPFKKLDLRAPVPLIPPQHRPKVITDAHFILWEVDVWEMVPPTDPYLLRRITKNIFAIEAQWDLTEIEKAAMAGRIY